MSDTTLYRLYDAEGELLYVGITNSLSRRIAEHAKGKPWMRQAVGATFDHFPTRELAVEAEREAILNERPRHNVQHVPSELRVEQVRAVCHACGFLIEPATSGYLEVDCLEAMARITRVGAALLPWGAWHDRCRAPGTDCGEPWQIDLHVLSNRDQLRWWDREVRARRWAPYTNWHEHVDAVNESRSDGMLRVLVGVSVEPNRSLVS